MSSELDTRELSTNEVFLRFGIDAYLRPMSDEQINNIINGTTYHLERIKSDADYKRLWYLFMYQGMGFCEHMAKRYGINQS